MVDSGQGVVGLAGGGLLAYLIVKEFLAFLRRNKDKAQDERTTTTAGEKPADYWLKAIDEIIGRHAERLRREADGRLRAVEQALTKRADELKQETATNRVLLRAIREDQIRRGEREDA